MTDTPVSGIGDREMSDLRPAPPRERQKWADAGAARQGDARPLRECATCGGFVAFVQSSRTGKWYLADCFRYRDSERFYYVKASPHFRTCERVVAERAADAERERAAADHDERFGLFRVAVRELNARYRAEHGDAWDKRDPVYVAEWDALAVGYGLDHLTIGGES